MGGRAGGGGAAGFGLGIDAGYSGPIQGVESLKNIEDRQLYKELGQGIGRYYSVMGLEERNVKLADLPMSVNGVTVPDGENKGVYLNKALFKKGTVQSITQSKVEAYKSGWSTETNKPVVHTLTHELAHSTWNTFQNSPKSISAGKEIQKVYQTWTKDRKKTGYGKYARSNVNEFWAETITKGVHGQSDKYTKQLMKIARKYKL